MALVHPESITLPRAAYGDLTSYIGYAAKAHTTAGQVLQSVTNEQCEGIIADAADTTTGSAVTLVVGGVGWALAGTGAVTVDVFQVATADGLTDSTTLGDMTPTMAMETRLAGEFYLCLIDITRRIDTYA